MLNHAESGIAMTSPALNLRVVPFLNTTNVSRPEPPAASTDEPSQSPNAVDVSNACSSDMLSCSTASG